MPLDFITKAPRRLWRRAKGYARAIRSLHQQDSDADRKWQRFHSDLAAYNAMCPVGKVPDVRYLYPCLEDWTAETDIEPTYYYQDCWAFELIVRARPACHIDIGSHHKYVALLSKVIPTTMVDIRPISLPLETLTFKTGSILELPFPDGSVESLSSLCVIEHIGLGRYGDPLDPEGSEKAVAELKRVAAPGASLYLSVPIDDVDRTYFNAHRAFAEATLQKLFHPFEIVERRYIYGRRFTDKIEAGFGTGCYHLRRPMLNN